MLESGFPIHVLLPEWVQYSFQLLERCGSGNLSQEHPFGCGLCRVAEYEATLTKRVCEVLWLLSDPVESEHVLRKIHGA